MTASRHIFRKARRPMGHSRHCKGRLYTIYRKMRERCLDSKCPEYRNYGARGIVMCTRWLASFDAFADDVGDHPGDGFSLDRIDNNGNYEPGNTRWATTTEQARNKRSSIRVGDEHVNEVASRLKLSPIKLRTRIRRNIDGIADDVSRLLDSRDPRLTRRTCRRGHPIEGNTRTYPTPNGSVRRVCKLCMKIACQRHKEKSR